MKKKFFFEFLKFREPAPKNRGPQSKFRFLQIFRLDEDSASRKIERPSSKNVGGDRQKPKLFQNFDNFGGPEPKPGPLSKFRFLQILGLGEDSASRKFERPSSKTVEGDRIFNQNLKNF